ncbi:MAG TPA: hypothetical protein VMV93_12375 [Chloroflexota bacterium]|nr:hypothetical protein [Chloroflexota bacterium]
MRRSVFALASLVALLVGATYLPGVGAQVAGGPDYDIPGGHFYTQTNSNAGPNYGYRITNERGIGFWDQFQKLGGFTALGYPASRRFQLDGFFVQATQKYLLQWRPEVSQVYFVNVFDKLHDQGKDAALQQQFGIPAQVDPSVDQATRLGWLNADPAIAAKFGTGPAALQTNGLPTSQITPAGPFSIIRAERDAIQKWNSAGPGGITPGTVSVVNGGDVAKTLGLVPGDAQITETAQGQPLATPTPAATATPVGPTATPTVNPALFPFISKSVNTPPIDCGNGNRVTDCNDSDPNAGTQYIQGHVLDKSGNGLSGYTLEMTYYGNSVMAGTEGDGLFTFILSNSCPAQNLTYQVFVVDGQGRQSSDMRTVNYTNCNTAGVFHFDFVKTS